MTRYALALAALLALPAPAAAQYSPAATAVAQARAQGLVGERYDGYLGVAGTVGSALARQIASINLLRRSLYSQLSRSRGVSTQEIGITAGCQLLGRVQVGERYLESDNRWRLRGATAGPPIPDYCR